MRSWFQRIVQFFVPKGRQRANQRQPSASSSVVVTVSARLLGVVERFNRAKLRPPDVWVLTWDVQVDPRDLHPFVCPDEQLRVQVFENHLPEPPPQVGDWMRVEVRRSHFYPVTAWIEKVEVLSET